MKYLLLFSLVINTACVNLALKYDADLETEKGPAHFVFEESKPHRILSVGCALTAPFMGGACWEYIGQPKSANRRELIEDAQNELKTKYHIEATAIKFDQVTKIGWEEKAKRSNLVYQNGGSSR